MIDKIIEASLRQRAFVLLAAVGLLILGLHSAARLPIDAVTGHHQRPGANQHRSPGARSRGN